MDEKLGLSCFYIETAFFHVISDMNHTSFVVESTFLSFNNFLNEVVKILFHSPEKACRIFSETVSGAFLHAKCWFSQSRDWDWAEKIVQFISLNLLHEGRSCMSSLYDTF